MKYNRRLKRTKGSLLLIRHLPDGSIFRVMSNALYGLAIGEDSDVSGTLGWAAFSAKTTYLKSGAPGPIGNHIFTTYVQDRGVPGAGADQFWTELFD